MIKGCLESTIQGIDTIGLLREVVVEDAILFEKSDELYQTIQQSIEDIKAGNEDRALSTLMSMSVDEDIFETVIGYAQNASSLLITKRLINKVGCKMEPGAYDGELTVGHIRDILLFNKLITKVLPNAVRNMFRELSTTVAEGSFNDIYDAFHAMIKKTMLEVPKYASMTFENEEARADFLDTEADEFIKRMANTAYSASILLDHKGVPEAKEEIKTLLKNVGLNCDQFVDEAVTPEMLISDVGTLFGAFQNMFAANPAALKHIQDHNLDETITKGMNSVLVKLGEENKIGTFQQVNSMTGNIYASTNAFEIFALMIAKLGHKLYTAEKIEDLDSNEYTVYTFVVTAADELFREYNVDGRVNTDTLHYGLLSAVALRVSDVVLDNPPVRGTDAAFQSVASSIANILRDDINEYIKKVFGQNMEPEVIEGTEPAAQA
ncbi:MAG: hypothetical protein ACRC92_27080 [Peptostreptococcaceae bacterium]